MEKVRSKDGSAIAFDRFGDEPPVILVCGGSTAWQTHHWPRPWHCTSPSSTTAVGVTVVGDNAVWAVHGLGKMRDKVKEVSVRKGLVSEFVTLDGAVENPGGAEGFEHGWVGTPTARPARKRLTRGIFPSWSSDGKRIIYTAYSGGRPYLSVMNSDGSGRPSLGASLLERLSSRVADEEPAFSLSGERIAFVSYPGNDNAEIPVLTPTEG